MLEMLRELTASMWFEPMQNFAQLVYNAAEILPVIEAEKCVEFGTINGQELLIYEIDPADNRKRIKYSCSITHIYGKLVLQNVYSADGELYEYDFDRIYDELSKEEKL